ncbi:hypothetical protein Sango_1974900 [Sesamum angolense]|uniref:Uncharacterized protein n=1 Tax=Sesamum angolense TaxID=2727404 RepID=A0AAE2BNJ0_9LAMI|nr:hypothetical protein Sango_1974900 [Sesamum angolense]
MLFFFDSGVWLLRLRRPPASADCPRRLFFLKFLGLNSSAVEFLLEIKVLKDHTKSAQRSERVKSVDLHPTEPCLACLWEKNYSCEVTR